MDEDRQRTENTAVEVRSGDSHFDQRFYLDCDTAAFARDYFMREAPGGPRFKARQWAHSKAYASLAATHKPGSETGKMGCLCLAAALSRQIWRSRA